MEVENIMKNINIKISCTRKIKKYKYVIEIKKIGELFKDDRVVHVISNQFYKMKKYNKKLYSRNKNANSSAYIQTTYKLYNKKINTISSLVILCWRADENIDMKLYYVFKTRNELLKWKLKRKG